MKTMVYCVFRNIEKATMSFEELISIHERQLDAEEQMLLYYQVTEGDSFFIQEWEVK